LCLGDQAQQKRFLGRFADTGAAERLGAVAWAERPNSDLPLEGFATTAKKDGAGWVLNGRKAFVVNGGAADLHAVFAQLDGKSGWDGIAAFVVEAGTQGLTAGEKHVLIGLETVQASEVILEGCKVPDGNRLAGGSDFRAAVERMFARGALINAARQVGLARASYELALEYTQERKAFGKPVAHFQAIAFTLAEMAMDVEAVRWMVWRAAADLDAGRGPVALAEAIAHANETAWRVADNAVQLLGGAGYLQDHPVEKWLRDTKALALLSPPSSVWQLAVAGSELGHSINPPLPSVALQPFFT
jgi:alkylation response protein AidB-like acyl-CoA dehydrogenase